MALRPLKSSVASGTCDVKRVRYSTMMLKSVVMALPILASSCRAAAPSSHDLSLCLSWCRTCCLLLHHRYLGLPVSVFISTCSWSVSCVLSGDFVCMWPWLVCWAL